MSGCVLFTRIGLHVRVVGAISGDFNICDPEEGRFNVWNQSFTEGDPGKTAVFHSFFPYVLEIARSDYTRSDSTALGVIRTFSRIDRIFINLPMAEARDFHSHSHVHSQLDVQASHFFVPCSFMTITDSPDPFCALAEFQVLLNKAKKMTSRELSLQTPDCIGAGLLIASTALRAYRNRHLGTLMRCCEAWKPVEDCFDTSSFECIDFQRLSQILAGLTRESFEAREAEVSTLAWTQTEKDIALARCRCGQRAWRSKKPVLFLSAVTDEEGHPLDKEDDSGRRPCEYWGTIFQARDEGPRHHQHEVILRFVQHAPDDIRWTIDKTEFDDLLALKKDWAPSPDGTRYGVYRCAGGLGSKFLYAYQAVLEGSSIPDCFAVSRTIFIPKTSDIDDLGRIIRSPDALRPLTSCNCDCKLLTSAICRGLHCYTMRCIHPSQRCISSRQMTDNIFEIETTALAHVACAPQESGVLLTDFAAAYPSVNHAWIFSALENTGLPDFLCRFLGSM